MIEEEEVEPRMDAPQRGKPCFPSICAPRESLFAAFEFDHLPHVIDVSVSWRLGSFA
jgi:hypothetical protein